MLSRFLVVVAVLGLSAVASHADEDPIRVRCSVGAEALSPTHNERRTLSMNAVFAPSVKHPEVLETDQDSSFELLGRTIGISLSGTFDRKMAGQGAAGQLTVSIKDEGRVSKARTPLSETARGAFVQANLSFPFEEGRGEAEIMAYCVTR